jgi:alpha-glucosidase
MKNIGYRRLPERFKRLYTDSQPEVLDWLADLRKVIDEFPGRVLLAEVDTSPEKIAQFYGEKNHPIIHLPLNYGLLDNLWEAPEIAAMINEYRNSLPEHGWSNWSLEAMIKSGLLRLSDRSRRGLRPCYF